MNRQLLVIFGYGGPVGQSIVDLMEPHYNKSGCDLLYVFPTDEPLRQGGLAYGLSEKYGSELIARTIFAMNHASRMDYDHFWFIEADSLVLKEFPKASSHLECFVYQNHDPSFQCDHFMHWPWGIEKHFLEAMMTFVAKKYIAFDEHKGFADRWLGVVLEFMGCVPEPTTAGFSCNRVDSPELVAVARQAIANGASVVHGVKTQEDIDRILI